MNKHCVARIIGLIALVGLLVTNLVSTTPTANAEASWAVGRLDTVVRGGDNQVYHKYYQGGWSGWQPLGSPPGGATSDPTAVSWGYERLDIFVRGGNNALYHKLWTPAGWSDWVSRGGLLNGGADVASWAPGRLDIVARGGDDSVQHLWYQDGLGWGAWESLGGAITADPSAVSWGPDRLDIFVRGTDAALYQKLWTPAGWSDWVRLGGALAGGPDAASWAPGHLDVYVRGGDNQIHHLPFDAGAWQSWSSIGGALTSDPAAVSWGPGSMDVFARGTDNALQHRHWENGWGLWESLGTIPGMQPPIIDDRVALATWLRDSPRVIHATIHSSGVVDSANARQNIVDTANGGPARRSSYGGAPGGTVYLSVPLLSGMRALADSYSYNVSEIAGGSHSSGSRHYAGVAVDVNRINGSSATSSNPYQGSFRSRCAALGATEVLGPGDAGHDTHVHCGWPRP